jgi:hypothetical protein
VPDAIEDVRVSAMSERGVFAVDRGIWDHDLLSDSEPFSRREAWLWLLSEAAWKPHKRRIMGRPIDLGRGQYAGSLRFIASKWRWSEPRTRRFLAALISAEMIDANSDAGVTVVTICNYDEYQRVSLPTDAIREIDGGAEATQQRRKVEDMEDKEEETTSLRSVVAPTPPVKMKRTRARTALPDDWSPDERDRGYAVSSGFDAPATAKLGCGFANYHRSRGNLMADWHAAWRTWIDNEVKYAGGRNGNGSSQNRADTPAGRASSREADILAAVGRGAMRVLENGHAARSVGPVSANPGTAERNDPERDAAWADYQSRVGHR